MFDVEQERLAIGDNFRRHLIFLQRHLGDEALPEWARRTLVPPGKNGDTAAGLLEGPGKDLDDRCLPGTADGEIADADHLTAQGVIAKNPVPPEPEPTLDDPLEEQRQTIQSRTRETRAQVTAAIKDDVEDVLFNCFGPLPHVPA